MVSHQPTQKSRPSSDPCRGELCPLTVLDALPVCISYVDATERYQFVNRAYETWFEVSRDQILGCRLENVLGAEAYQIAKPFIERALSGEPVSYEKSLPYQRAGTRYVRASLIPDLGEGHFVRGYVALIQDITQQKHTEDSLRYSEERFRKAIVEAPFPILIHGEDGRVHEISRTVSEVTGYTTDEIQTIRDWTSLAYGDRRAAVQEDINRLYQLDKRADEGEYTVRTKQGTSRTWLFSSAPLGQLDEGTRLVISMAADVTEQKRVEANLATRLKQQAVVAQISQVALSGFELPTLFDQVAQQAAQGLEVDYCQVLELQPDGQSLLLVAGVGWQPGLVGTATVSSDTYSQAGYALMSKHPVVASDLATETRFEVSPLLVRHGIVSGISTIILGEQGLPFGVLSVHHCQQRPFTRDDVNFVQTVANILATAIGRKRAEADLQRLNAELEDRVQERTAQLEASNQELEAFSYSVSHDLRAPLRYITGFVDLLRKRLLLGRPDDTVMHYLDVIQDSTQQAGVLIDDLLMLSRTSRIKMQCTEVDMNQTVEAVRRGLEPMTRDRAVHWQVDALPHVMGDPNLLRSALANIIDNALKYTRPRDVAEIHIHSMERKGDIVFCVQDNGIGFNMKYAHKLFETFQRLHHDDQFEGTGIGLATTRRIIYRHGGQTWAEGKVEGGACFCFSLPKQVDTI